MTWLEQRTIASLMQEFSPSLAGDVARLTTMGDTLDQIGVRFESNPKPGLVSSDGDSFPPEFWQWVKQEVRRVFDSQDRKYAQLRAALDGNVSQTHGLFLIAAELQKECQVLIGLLISFVTLALLDLLQARKMVW